MFSRFDAACIRCDGITLGAGRHCAHVMLEVNAAGLLRIVSK
jgi:hypothetical protein